MSSRQESNLEVFEQALSSALVEQLAEGQQRIHQVETEADDIASHAEHLAELVLYSPLPFPAQLIESLRIGQVTTTDLDLLYALLTNSQGLDLMQIGSIRQLDYYISLFLQDLETDAKGVFAYQNQLEPKSLLKNAMQASKEAVRAYINVREDGGDAQVFAADTFELYLRLEEDRISEICYRRSPELGDECSLLFDHLYWSLRKVDDERRQQKSHILSIVMNVRYYINRYLLPSGKFEMTPEFQVILDKIVHM